MFLFRNHLSGPLRKHMFTFDWCISINFVSVFQGSLLVIALFRAIIDYFSSKTFLIFLILVSCNNKALYVPPKKHTLLYSTELPWAHHLVKSSKCCSQFYYTNLPTRNRKIGVGSEKSDFRIITFAYWLENTKIFILCCVLRKNKGVPVP